MYKVALYTETWDPYIPDCQLLTADDCKSAELKLNLSQVNKALETASAEEAKRLVTSLEKVAEKDGSVLRGQFLDYIWVK